MNLNIKSYILIAFMVISTLTYSQDPTDWSKLKLDATKEKKFLPYVAIRHSLGEDFLIWKESNKFQYLKEMWYFTESFYVMRNYSSEGIPLNEEIIDISRFESNRKLTEEAIVILPGFKDALVLLPSNKLVYKP